MHKKKIYLGLLGFVGISVLLAAVGLNEYLPAVIVPAALIIGCMMVNGMADESLELPKEEIKEPTDTEREQLLNEQK